MRHPAVRAVTVPAAISLVLIALGCAPAGPPSPPPAEPHTAFAPVEIEIGGDPDWLGVGFGSLWVKADVGTVSRIDLATGEVAAEIEAHDLSGDLGCSGIGVGTDSVWTCAEQAVVRIDPTTDDVVASIRAAKVWSQGRIVQAAGRMWVLSGNGDQLVGVAEADGSLSEPIVLPVPCTDLGAVADIVYVVCEAAGRMLRVDPAAASVSADVPIVGPTHVSAADNGVWVAAAQGVLRLDLDSLEPSLTIDGLTVGFFGTIRADDSGVWVRRVDPFLTRIDGASGAVTRIVSAPWGGAGDVIADGDRLWASDVDGQVVVRLDLPVGP